MNLRFHWMLPKAGEVSIDRPQTPLEAARYRIESHRSALAARPDLKGWLHFARHAENAGIDSVLISFSRYEPDPLMVSCALGQATRAGEAWTMRLLRPVLGWVPRSVRPIAGEMVAQAVLNATLAGRPGVQMLSSGEMQESR